MIINKDWVLHAPIWHNPELRVQTIPEWNKKSIRTKWDLLTSNQGTMSQEEFEDYYQRKTNFLEYGRVKIMVKEFLSDKEMPLYNEINHQNCMINMIVSLDRKGVSNMYNGIHGRTFPSINQVKILIGKTCNHKRYIAAIRGKVEQFEKDWNCC